MTLVTSSEAANRLGVSARQVQRLVHNGQLEAVGTDRIDYASVLQLLAIRQGDHHRAWVEATAWAAVAVLSGFRADWVGQAQRSRLKANLRSMTAVDLVARTRNRATIQRMRGHSAAMTRIREQIVLSGSSAGVTDLTPVSNRVEGYVDVDQRNRLSRTYHLEHDWDWNVTLRVTTFDLEVIKRLAAQGSVLAALDLAGSLDARERAAGLSVLDQTMGRLHE